jgi:hypothetical protein
VVIDDYDATDFEGWSMAVDRVIEARTDANDVIALVADGDEEMMSLHEELFEAGIAPEDAAGPLMELAAKLKADRDADGGAPPRPPGPSPPPRSGPAPMARGRR